MALISDDAPADFDAAFALGASQLRTAFNADESGQCNALRKQAQAQLLQAAKLNSSHPGPFALLGICYEEGEDIRRAIGCYVKALQLDPAHPVAGRGLLRLQSHEKVAKMIEVATNANSALNGWAWRSTGQHKATIEGDDELAVVALRKALRCSDIIEAPNDENLGAFFSKPFSQSKPSDYGYVWAELAACYRRLGRYTSAIRAYQAAYESAGESLSSWILCSWAQVELEVGLLEGAEKKFARVLLTQDNGDYRQTAAYGQGLALLSISRRDLQDGKLGSAFETVLQANSLILETRRSNGMNSGCVMKLAGDLYSFGASFPSYMFDSSQHDTFQQGLKAQLEFVRNGEESYRAAERAYRTCQFYEDDDEAANHLFSAIICDIGTNILLQSQLLCQLHSNGTVPLEKLIESIPAVQESYDSASSEFKRCLQQNPVSAPAWCGLGCAMAGHDPMLAQHAFCRALQLDRLFPDAYSNLACLYTSHQAFSQSDSVMDGLTQVADTPMLWINRALAFEQNVVVDNNVVNAKDAANKIVQAAAAYRVALQVMKHPFAMFGLSLSCRISNATGSNTTPLLACVEALCYASEFISARGSADKIGLLMADLMALEERIYSEAACDLSLSSASPNGNEIEAILKILACLKDSSNILSGLNLNLIQDCLDILVAATTRRKEFPSKKTSLIFEPPTVTHSLTLIRNIIDQPDEGELWLDLAKQLCRKGIETAGTFDEAQEAAARANHLLTQQLLLFRIRTVLSSMPNAPVKSPAAKLVSDLLALLYWLSTQHSWSVAHQMPPCCFDLQRALMLSPNNTLVRSALSVS